MMSLFAVNMENVNAVTEGMILLYLLPDAQVPIPAGWECISCLTTDPFYERYPRISTVYGLQGGSFMHNHTITDIMTTPSASTIFNKPGAANAWNANDNLHKNIGFSQIIFPQNVSVFNTSYYRVIKYKTGIPSSIPEFACGFLNSTIVPDGFTDIFLFNNTLVMGNKTDPAYWFGKINGISHSHWGINITTGYGDTGNAFDSGTYQNTSTDTHTHKVNNINFSEVDYTLEAPPFLNLPLVCAFFGDFSPIPNGFIAMFNTTVTNSSFTMLNASTQLNRYIMVNMTPGSFNTTGGSFNHTHLNSTNWNSTIGSTGNPRILQVGGYGGARGDHTHIINFTTSSANNTPPYTTVILAMYTPENVPVSQPSLPTKVGCYIISKVDELFDLGRPEECEQTYELS